MARTILLTGASGYVGGQLAPLLLERGHTVRALMRNPDPDRAPDGTEPMEGDALSGEGLEEALRGADVAYYLIHSMGDDGDEDFVERDKRAADNFGRAAKQAGVSRVVYLGGLSSEAEEDSKHLRSRHEVAEVLGEHVDDLAYARAAMVLGAGSASYDILSNLVKRLPVMITPRWIDTRTQPIAVRDVVHALRELGDREDASGEIELGGADVLSYRDMMFRFAKIRGRRKPAIVKVPVLTPTLSSYWVALVGGVDPGVAKPLVEGLGSEMVVTTPPPAGVNDDPMGFDDAVRAAIEEAGETPPH